MAGAISHVLTPLQQRFVIWRRKRTRGKHIPPDLWLAAVEAARRQGVWKTSQQLCLDYSALAKRLKKSPLGRTGSLPFMEVPGKLLVPQPGCVLELQDREGLRLRVELSDAANAEGLARSLWRERR